MQPTAPDASPLQALLGSLAIFFIFGLIFYLYFSITLMIIARKSHTPNAAFAWFPVLNLILMCQIARRSGALVLLMLIPLVNIFAFAIVWMSIAEVRGKPSWIGALILLPVVNLFVPAYLASGEARDPNAPTAPPRCPHCQATLEPSETFCGECGNPVPMTAAPARAASGNTALVGLAVGAVALLIIGVVAWFFLFREIPYTPPNRQQPQLPQRAEGTMSEFPVDTATTAQAKPTAVVTQNFGQQGGSTTVKTPKEWLPPGVDKTAITRKAGAMTSATYRPQTQVATTSANAKSGTATASTSDSVYVHVLDAPADFGNEIADTVSGTMRGDRTGVKVNSPDGDIYSGSRIRNAQTVVYVLSKQAGNIVIIIYSPNPALQETADRLARNVGNGEGLNDYPEVKSSLWTLPARPPADLALQEVNTFTSEDFDRAMNEVESGVGKSDAEAQKALAQLRIILPERMTVARYLDGARKEWNVINCDFVSARRASNTWMFLRWTIGLTAMRSVSVGNEEGLLAEDSGERILFYKKGPYIVIISSPSAASYDKLLALAGGFQI
ncbi:MAG: DUF5684 domain-containing protein [Acidobacteriota bacterium]